MIRGMRREPSKSPAGRTFQVLRKGTIHDHNQPTVKLDLTIIIPDLQALALLEQKKRHSGRIVDDDRLVGDLQGVAEICQGSLVTSDDFVCRNVMSPIVHPVLNARDVTRGLIKNHEDQPDVEAGSLCISHDSQRMPTAQSGLEDEVAAALYQCVYPLNSNTACLRSQARPAITVRAILQFFRYIISVDEVTGRLQFSINRRFAGSVWSRQKIQLGCGIVRPTSIRRRR